MTEDEARDQLRRMVASDTFPTLDGYELSDLLRLARRPDHFGVLDVGVPARDGTVRYAADGEYPVWAPGTAYAAGALVVPRRRNGKVYSCTVPGTSGSDDPGFPTTGTVTDGGVTWTAVPQAVVWLPTYDLNAAAAEGWRWKAGKTSDAIAFASQGDNYSADQLHAHCLEMARYYDARTGPRSIKTPSVKTKPLDVSRLPRAN